MDDEALKNVQYVLFDEYGRPRKCVGGHILVDGGYLKHACFICPQNQRSDTSSVYWSELVESVRKDIECVFGILKARFRTLRNYLTFKHQLWKQSFNVAAFSITCYWFMMGWILNIMKFLDQLESSK